MVYRLTNAVFATPSWSKTFIPRICDSHYDQSVLSWYWTWTFGCGANSTEAVHMSWMYSFFCAEQHKLYCTSVVLAHKWLTGCCYSDGNMIKCSIVGRPSTDWFDYPAGAIFSLPRLSVWPLLFTCCVVALHGRIPLLLFDIWALREEKEPSRSNCHFVL